VRVFQGQWQQLAALFHNDAVGTRRQRHDARAFSNFFDQQGAMRRAVEHADLSGSVQGQEAFATLFSRDLDNRRGAHLEAADVLEALLAIRVARHEPLAQSTFGVAEDHRDAPHQLGTGRDLGRCVVRQLVAPVKALVAQAEYIGLRPAVDHIQPLLTRVDVQRLDLLSHLREVDAGLGIRDLAGHHVFFASHRQHVQLRTARTRQHQRRIVNAEVHVIQRTALGVERNWRFAIRVFNGRGDGLFVVRVGDSVAMTEHQCLTVGQAQYHNRITRLVFTDRRHLRARRQRQANPRQLIAGLRAEEQHQALVGYTHADLILLLNGEHQRLAGILHPHRRQCLPGVQVCALKQREHHIAEEEENQGDCAEYGKTADKYIPAGQVIFKRTDAALALEFRRIEINALGSGCRSHWGIGQIIHAHTLAVLYDRKMTKQ